MNTFLALSTVAALALLCLSVMAGRCVPVSLSDSYYKLGRYGWMFQLMLSATAVTLFPVWVSSSGPDHEWMVFLSCASLLFVASAPCFRQDLQGKIHYSSAVACCICSLLWQVSEGLWDVTLWFAFVAGMLSLQWRNKWCWWMEAAVAGSVYCNLYRMNF